MSDLKEIEAAVRGAQAASDLPIVASMSFDTGGRTMMGVKPADAALHLQKLGVDVIGANCGRTLSETLQAVKEMREALPDAVLMAKPNAGLPGVDDGNVVYDVSPQVMVDYGRQFSELGVRIFGGCCGSDPEHIHAVAENLGQ
jgi:5-methyltetrahydrofolate--homocysteine methyltransferase